MMKKNNHPSASVFIIVFLIITFLLVSAAFAVDISVTPQSGSIAVISGGLPQKITLLFSNYAPNESVNLTLNSTSDILLINSTTYNNIVSSSLDVFLYSIFYWMAFHFLRFGTTGFVLILFVQSMAVGVIAILLIWRKNERRDRV